MYLKCMRKKIRILMADPVYKKEVAQLSHFQIWNIRGKTKVKIKKYIIQLRDLTTSSCIISKERVYT